MCKTHDTEDMPLPVASAPNIGPTTDPNGVVQPGMVTPDASLASPSTQQVQVNKPTKFARALEVASGGGYDPTGSLNSPGEDTSPNPGGRKTKFGALLDILRPALEGGAVGGFTGKGHPGGGFGAANDYFMNQRMRQMQTGQFLLNLQKTQSELQKNSAEAGYYNRGGPVRTNQPVIGANGNYWTVDPVTRQLTDTGVEANGKDENFTGHMTDQGLVGVGNRGTVKRLALPNEPSIADAGGSLPTKAPTKFNSGSPRVPGAAPTQVAQAAASNGIPLGPPDKSKSAMDELTGGAVDALRKKHPDWTDDQILHQVKADEHIEKPDKNDQPLSGAKYNTARQKIQNSLNRELAQSESRRKSELAAAKKGDDPRTEQEIENDNADRKQEIHQKYADEASNMGIDLGQVPDYRAELNGDEGGGVPSTAPSGAQPKGQTQHKVGDTVMYKGKPYKIAGIKGGQAQLQAAH